MNRYSPQINGIHIYIQIAVPNYGHAFISTVWKFLKFSTTQILREINFEDSRSLKTAIFAISEALNFAFGKIQPSKIAKVLSKSEI